MRVETSAMDEWIASFTAMRVALGGATTRRKTLQPAPPQPTMATRARSSPTPSLHVSGTPAHRESPEIKDCHSRIDIYVAVGIEIAKESAIRPHSMRDTVPSSGVPRSTEAVVIGGGCMGTSIAWHLARRGVDVVLLERTHLAAGATGHSGALVRQHYEARIGIRLARESLAFFRRFEKETGCSADFRTTGFLCGTRERDLPAFEALVGLLRAEGVRAERLALRRRRRWSRSSKCPTTPPSSTTRTRDTRTRLPPPTASPKRPRRKGQRSSAITKSRRSRRDRDRSSASRCAERNSSPPSVSSLRRGSGRGLSPRPWPLDCRCDTSAAKSRSCDDPSTLAHRPRSTSTSTETRTRGPKARRTRWPAT